MSRIAALALVVGVAAYAFLPGLHAGFVSDSWIFLHRARLPFSEVLRWFTPTADASFYRPGVEVAFWIDYRLFGLNPLPYHLIALACHAASALLVGAIARRLSGSQIAAWVAALAFLFAVSAQETLFDVADLHNVLGMPLLLGAVLAGLAGRRWLPAALVVVGLFIDESAVLVLPFLGVYVLTFARDRWRDLLPLAAVTVAYLGLRVLGGVASEDANHCLSAVCVAKGVDEYVTRLVLRPDALIVRHAAGLPALSLLALIGLGAGLRFRLWPVVRLGLLWMVGASLFFVLTLYPYASDRFLYIPSVGLAIVLGAVAAEAAGRRNALRGAVVLALIGAWIVAGAVSLHGRAEGWTQAGTLANRIVDAIVAKVPNPPERATIAVYGVPDLGPAPFPPGNTGPFAFHNGLPEALAFAYGRSDVRVLRLADGAAAPRGAIVVEPRGSW